jgi:hypothetical protein
VIINAEGTTTVLVAGVCLLVACGVIVWALDRAFNHQPPRDPAATNPWGIARVDDLMTLAEVANRAVRDEMAAKPRLGELVEQDMTLPPPLLGTLPPVTRPTIPSAWRASGDAARRADKRWLNGDADASIREFAQAFREREDLARAAREREERR